MLFSKPRNEHSWLLVSFVNIGVMLGKEIQKNIKEYKRIVDL